MMVADTSAFIAIVTNEPEREAFESSAIAQDGNVLMLAVSSSISTLQNQIDTVLVRSSF